MWDISNHIGQCECSCDSDEGVIPSSSDTSRISSTVSGKLMRCFSVVVWGTNTSQRKISSVRAKRIKKKTFLCRRGLKSSRSHHGGRLLGDQLQDVDDGDVAQPLSNGQGGHAVLHRESRGRTSHTTTG